MRKQRQERGRVGYRIALCLHLRVFSIQTDGQTTKLQQALPSIVDTEETFYTLPNCGAQHRND
jgi:hypothetical protein